MSDEKDDWTRALESMGWTEEDLSYVRAPPKPKAPPVERCIVCKRAPRLAEYPVCDSVQCALKYRHQMSKEFAERTRIKPLMTDIVTSGEEVVPNPRIRK